MAPATVIGSLLFLFLVLLIMAIVVSVQEDPQQSRPRKNPVLDRKSHLEENAPTPVILNRAERMELIESTRNMVVTNPAGMARLVRNWISDGS